MLSKVTVDNVGVPFETQCTRTRYSVSHRQTVGQTLGRHYDAKSRSYCVQYECTTG